MIELLVVMGIIGVLAMFLFVSYSRAQAKARDARRQADLGTITVSLESYYNDYNRYPTEEEITFGSPFGTYMSMVPNDPDPNKSYCYIPSSDGLSYTLGADYETTMEGVRCTPLDSTPVPTVPSVSETPVPTATPIPISTPAGCIPCSGLGVSYCCESNVYNENSCSATPLGVLPFSCSQPCSNVWRVIDYSGDCATGLTSVGQKEGEVCPISYQCGEIAQCTYQDESCDGEGENGDRYATCICW